MINKDIYYNNNIDNLKNKCSWIKTEARHDFVPKLFNINSVFTPSPNGSQNLLSSLDKNISFCSDIAVQPAHTKDCKLINDENIVKLILGRDKDSFKNISAGWQPMYVNTLDTSNPSSLGAAQYNVNFSEPTAQTGTPVRFCKINKVNKKYENLISIFDNIIAIPRDNKPEIKDKHIYLIQDVAGDIVKQLKYYYTPKSKQLHPDQKFHVHVINSVETIGDSASKIAPDKQKLYTYNSNPNTANSSCYNQVRLFSWLYSEVMNIPANDPLMISSYNITGNYLPNNQKKWIITQNWKGIGEPGGFYNNSNKDNDKTNIAKDITTAIYPSSVDGFLYGKSISDSSNNLLKKKRISLALQRKRSGDYLQIRFAKLFPEIVYNYYSSFHLIIPNKFGTDNEYDNPSVNNKYPPNSQFFSQEYIWNFPKILGNNLQARDLPCPVLTDPERNIIIRNNTFLVTLDWPCLCYAVYNKVNVIFHNNSPTCNYVLVFQF